MPLVSVDDLSEPQASARPAPSDETDLLGMVLIVAKHRRLVAATTLICTVAAMLFAFWLPNQYSAEARLLAPQSRNSLADLWTGSLSGVSGLGMAKNLSASALGLSDPNGMYVAVLESRTVADRLSERFDLQGVYHTELPEDTRRALGQVSEIASGKDGGITIQVTDRDPRRAAALANAYVEEFQRLTGQLALTEAAQRRAYYERELDTVKDQLSSAEAALKSTQEKTGMIEGDAQARSIVEATVALKAQVAAKEIEIQSMGTFATAQNPELIRAKEELTALRAQLARQEHGAGTGNGDVLVPTGEMPKVGLEYLRRSRDVKYYEQLFKVLATQYEAARADETRNPVVVQVLDTAVPPQRKSKPHRAWIVILVALLAGSGSVFASLLIEGWEQLRRDPLRAEQVHALKTMLLDDARGCRPYGTRA